ncbi:hypothetical protein COHA_002693 [Chlorella ohadii]|uniref:Uncharacterized protein n=1 Tax=Chlorella ohadii TaxID=2649997 RepID=A0AAD5DX69_9CHLO|nr:hypothetical protein COHA_002693 [Chlorella ohadii]
MLRVVEGSRDGRPPLGRDASSERAWRREGGAPEEPARERPRLNLAPRSAAPAAGAGAAAGASKASVFGAARPREEVLREQGRDAVKEDLRLEHEAVDRPETAEEKSLQEEITNLQIRVEAGEADAEYDGGEEGEGEGEEAEASSKTVAQALEELEGRLQKLQLELDSKAKYARAAGAQGEARERPPRREASPGGWRREGGEPNGAAAPRGFRDDRERGSFREERERRPASGTGEDRPPRREGEERRPRDNFPPRDRDASRDRPRW